MKANTDSQATEIKAEESSQSVDARIGRALKECLHAETGQHGDETYRVHSGSGSIYAVDLDGPDGRFCSCADSAAFCKHILHVLFVETPETLLSDITECEHGAPRCPGSEAIEFEDGKPQSEGDFPCFECFMDASQAENTESDEKGATGAITNNNERTTPIRSEPADFGGGESTGVQHL